MFASRCSSPTGNRRVICARRRLARVAMERRRAVSGLWLCLLPAACSVVLDQNATSAGRTAIAHDFPERAAIPHSESVSQSRRAGAGWLRDGRRIRLGRRRWIGRHQPGQRGAGGTPDPCRRRGWLRVCRRARVGAGSAGQAASAPTTRVCVAQKPLVDVSSNITARRHADLRQGLPADRNGVRRLRVSRSRFSQERRSRAVPSRTPESW